MALFSGARGPGCSDPCYNNTFASASGGYLNSVANTDEGNAILYGGGTYVNLYHLRQIDCEEPGQADGPGRVRQLAGPPELTLSPLPEPGVGAGLAAGLALVSALAQGRRRD